jgi:hypothetical protein
MREGENAYMVPLLGALVPGEHPEILVSEHHG